MKIYSTLLENFTSVGWGASVQFGSLHNAAPTLEFDHIAVLGAISFIEANTTHLFPSQLQVQMWFFAGWPCAP